MEVLKVLLKEYSHVDIDNGDVETRGRNRIQEHCTGNTMALINQMSVEVVTDSVGGKNQLTTKSTGDSRNMHVDTYQCVNVWFHCYDMMAHGGHWFEFFFFTLWQHSYSQHRWCRQPTSADV